MTDRRRRSIALWAALAAGAIAAPAAPAGASDWRVAASAREEAGGYAAYLVDRDSVARAGDVATFALQIVYQRPQQGGRFNRAVDRVQANCRDRSLTLLSQEFFLRRAPAGRNDTQTTAQTQPGWALATVIDAACTGQYRSDRVRDVFLIAGSMFEIMEREAAARRGAQTARN